MNRKEWEGKNASSFCPIRVFRKTPQVSFFDTGIDRSNGADVVIHHKNAISPPNDGDFEQYYIHHHQIDHNQANKEVLF